MNNKEQFKLIYTESLIEAIRLYPDKYMFREETVPLVVERMIRGVENGGFNHNTPAFKIACEKLDIKYTRKAILEYYNN